MSNNMNDLIQARVQEETKLLWEIKEVYWSDKEDGSAEGIIVWSYEHAIRPDDDPHPCRYLVRAQSNMTNPTKLYAIRLEHNGMQFLSTVFGFFGI